MQSPTLSANFGKAVTMPLAIAIFDRVKGQLGNRREERLVNI